jgi:V/A-type H+-transporting ATPase subunit I
MFSPARMERLSVVLLGSDARAVLRGLGGLGAMELAESRPGADTAPLPPPDNSAAMARCRGLLARAAELKSLLGPAPAAEPWRFSGFDEASAVFEKVSREAAAVKGREAARAAAAGLAALRARLAPYAALPLPADGEGLAFLYFSAGSVAAAALPGLLAGLGPDMLALPLAEGCDRRSLAALCPAGSAAGLDAALKRSGFLPETRFAGGGRAFSELFRACVLQERAALVELALAVRGVKEAAKNSAAYIAGAEAAAAEELSLLEAEGRSPRTASAVFISGWAPAADAALVSEALSGASAGRCAVELAPAGEDAPVLLRPPGMLKAFAGLVRAYGLPGYGEVDPTAFAAAVYVLLFGAMFGDVGHGTVVCLAALVLSRLPKAGSGDAAIMMLCCGLTSMFFGLVYGSCFGLDVFRKYALWRDPLYGDPFTLVLLALGAGAAVITLGLLLNIVNRARLGDRLGAALGRFGAAGLVFYWCGLLMAAGKLDAGAGLPVLGLALACWVLKDPAVCLLKGGRGAALGEAVAEAAVGAFEGALLYLANTISFARLAAYAMSHAALLASAFMLAEAADKVWGEGSLPGICAIVAGNLAAILLEGVVAAVQALRLEYYEFFGKFLEGGGRPFRPFVVGTGGMQ